ncbi:MAG TPA: 2-amino-4-hydroxy-6-hydroxymethyldihydropteridine diphosphokinase [Gammaproteobacteria bacterium]|nr:2-amino-4-hydroxy-6-hydroxymethyldihydropteridine diphosphokinase [Gammaproteobacteria bacterium]
MPSTAYISLGSNLDNPIQQVKKAIFALQQIPDTTLFAYSSLYQSAPVGYWPQPDFINAVACIQTDLSAEKLLGELHSLEFQQGRVRNGEKNRPRTLDLDLLLYDDEIIQKPDLTIPHPRLHERAFVLLPLAEIAANLLIPPKTSLSQLIAMLPSKQLQTIKALEESLIHL